MRTVAHVARDTWYMVGRQTRNLTREPIWIVLLLVQPLIWLLLYGQLFKRVVHLPGGGFGGVSYITFLAPAIVVMNAFFGGTWSGMPMISDIDRDVIPRFLATPVSRLSLVASQVVRAAINSTIQALIILLVALALGVHIHTGAIGWLIVLAAAALVSAAFSGLSQAIALLTRKEATMIALANFIGLPLLFLSSTLISIKQIPDWMRTAAKYNPVNWGVDAARQVVLPGTDWASVGTHLGLLLGLTIVMTALATWTFRVYQRTL
jgi:ABC-2 type transport system permease protein